MRKLRVGLFLLAYVGFVAAYLVGAGIPISGWLAEHIYEVMERQFTGLPAKPGPALKIFLHNALVCVLTSAPFVGPFALLLSAFSTGLAVNALIVVRGLPRAAALWLLAKPFTILEVAAYSLAAGEAAYMSVVRDWRGEKLKYLACLLGAMAILAVAAAIEASTMGF